LLYLLCGLLYLWNFLLRLNWLFLLCRLLDLLLGDFIWIIFKGLHLLLLLHLVLLILLLLVVILLLVLFGHLLHRLPVLKLTLAIASKPFRLTSIYTLTSHSSWLSHLLNLLLIFNVSSPITVKRLFL